MADIRIAVFNVETGVIQRIVKLNMAAPNQAGEGEDEIELPPEWEGDDTTHHVFDGELVKNDPPAPPVKPLADVAAGVSVNVTLPKV